MFELCVNQDFIAQHFLIGGDWGDENQKHSHRYRIEVQLEGQELDQHGYLVDIVNVKDSLEKVTAYFRDTTLNELPEFKDLNPSIEHLARISFQLLLKLIDHSEESLLSVKIWEDDLAWALYRRS